LSARHTLRQRHLHIAPRRLTRPYLTLARFTPSTWSPTLTLGRLPVPAQALTPRHLKRLYHPSVPRRTPVPTPQAIRSCSPNAFKPPTAHAVNVPTTSQYLTRSGPHPLLQTSTATRRTHRPPRILTFPTNNPPTPLLDLQSTRRLFRSGHLPRDPVTSNSVALSARRRPPQQLLAGHTPLQQQPQPATYSNAASRELSPTKPRPTTQPHPSPRPTSLRFPQESGPLHVEHPPHLLLARPQAVTAANAPIPTGGSKSKPTN